MYKWGQVIVMFIEQPVKQLMSRAESDFCLLWSMASLCVVFVAVLKFLTSCNIFLLSSRPSRSSFYFQKDLFCTHPECSFQKKKERYIYIYKEVRWRRKYITRKQERKVWNLWSFSLHSHQKGTWRVQDTSRIHGTYNTRTHTLRSIVKQLILMWWQNTWYNTGKTGG